MNGRPPLLAGLRRIGLVRMLSSIWFGLSLLLAILVYASVCSALPQVRGATEMSEMQIFNHWPFGVLIALFCLSLTLATVTRIRLNLINAGVLTVHTGLLLLAGGALYYFWTKIEGDVLLETPKIELRTADGRPIPTATLRVNEGETWEQTMPAFGGRVRVEVVDDGPEGQPISQAAVRVQLGDAEPQTVNLSRGHGSTATIGGRLQVALDAQPPQHIFLEDETPGIYYRKTSASERRFAEIHGLPLHRERYLDQGHPLRDRDGKPVPSKRTSPQVDVAGLTIPTGWFEPWRMPIDLYAPELPFDVRITGFVPYITGLENTVRPDGDRENPALEFGISAGGEQIRRWLLANDPKQSATDVSIPFAFEWVQSREQQEALFKPLVGPNELSVTVKDPPYSKTIPIQEGQTIELEGTPYTLHVKSLIGDWPMMTPGYEGARSTVAIIDVTSADRQYSRTVIERFPELIQDIDEEGVRHRDGPVDPNLVLNYRSVSKGAVLFAAGPDLPLQIGIFRPDGQVQHAPLEVGEPSPIEIADRVDITVHALHRNARQVREPIIEPVERRRPNISMRALSAIRLKLTGRGDASGWTDERWIAFSSYPNSDPRPLRIRLPGSEDTWELIYSRMPHDLGADLYADVLEVNFFPGRRSVESWRSEFFVKDRTNGSVQTAAVYTNQTTRVGKWTLFQSGAAGDHWSYTILGVGNRNGVWPMLLGCVLIPLGCLYAFYVKPVLLRRRRQQSTRPRQQMTYTESEPETERAAEPALMEV